MPRYVDQDQRTKKTKQQQIQRVSSRHADIARRKLMGQSNKQIAHEMSYTEARVSQITTSPKYLEHMQELEAELRTRFMGEKTNELLHGKKDPVMEYFESHAKNAAETLVGSMSDPQVKPEERNRTARDILDRTGRQKVERIEQHLTAEVDEETVVRFTEVLKEASELRRDGSRQDEGVLQE